MENLKALIISDFIVPVGHTSIDWEHEQLPALETFDVVLLDMTFKDKKERTYLCRDDILFALANELSDTNFLDINDIILVIVCGHKLESITIDLPDDPSDFKNSSTQRITFNNYDFLYQLIPAAQENFSYKQGASYYPIANHPVSLYLDRYKEMDTYIKYANRPNSTNPFSITPLAKMKKSSETFVSFQFSVGRGLVVVLPPYDISHSSKACYLLMKICRSYYKRRDTMRNFRDRLSSYIPDVVRESMLEALYCYNYDLYTASAIMCRRTLEISANNMGIERLPNLYLTIEKLYERQIIDRRMKKAAKEIRILGNFGAHEQIQITENMATEILYFMDQYLEHVYTYEERLDRLGKLREDTKIEEGR